MSRIHGKKIRTYANGLLTSMAFSGRPSKVENSQKENRLHTIF